ncbi:hypothetical protein NXS08_02605 [Gleimia sp. 6138-11-ORH1]|uniref:shikimate kinase n=1 Tax=Gleimia sp. 6138-11-ORH1 TaxID=2973937 RepID=UPI002169B7A2|nr:shikimate kinase [Gleimia sp. 6138-11-ORH1]MCS4484381.1 hypothetical protein [Gleimia sp. 6138-11-ORH1]
MENKPNLVIIGVSGAGKTEVAQAVATQLGLPLHESAHYTAKLSGQSPELLAVRETTQTQEHQLQAGALAALKQTGIVVLSPDAAIQPKVQEKLKELKHQGVKILELYADFNTLAQRTGLNAPRSISLGPTRRTFRLLVEAYRQTYAELADEKIDTSLTKPHLVAPRVVALLS